jgi:hypothetical protein
MNQTEVARCQADGCDFEVENGRLVKSPIYGLLRNGGNATCPRCKTPHSVIITSPASPPHQSSPRAPRFQTDQAEATA